MTLLQETQALLKSIQSARARLSEITPALFVEIRQGRGWTQKQLSERLGIGQAYISQIENGYDKTPDENVYYSLLIAANERLCPNCETMTMFDICAHCGYEESQKP